MYTLSLKGPIVTRVIGAGARPLEWLLRRVMPRPPNSRPRLPPPAARKKGQTELASKQSQCCPFISKGAGQDAKRVWLGGGCCKRSTDPQATRTDESSRFKPLNSESNARIRPGAPITITTSVLGGGHCRRQPPRAATHGREPEARAEPCARTDGAGRSQAGHVPAHPGVPDTSNAIIWADDGSASAIWRPFGATRAERQLNCAARLTDTTPLFGRLRPSP